MKIVIIMIGILLIFVFAIMDAGSQADDEAEKYFEEKRKC